MTAGYQVRAPWYVRERKNIDLNNPRARRPVIQMYDSTDFATQLTTDPGTSLKYGTDDHWSYPVPVKPSVTATGRDRFVTSKLVHTHLRKLYQPSHSRFYVVVVEVFCDEPGLPRAGSHKDIEVSFVMRRQHLTTAGGHPVVRKLARGLMVNLAKEQHGMAAAAAGLPDLDVDDLWWANEAARAQFEEDNAALISGVGAQMTEQAWMTGAAGGQWREVEKPHAEGRPDDREETFPMWRLPPRDEDCAEARTRSLWFGLVPTYSAEHWTDEAEIGDVGKLKTKLDDQEIYHLRCIVTRPPKPGHEHCPPKTDVSEATRPFRLAAAYDPDGTKNRTISVTAPDLRRLAARAGQKQGPGGLRITTPPGSGLGPVNFKDIPGVGIGKDPSAGFSICTFAFELFFIVAFFLFLLFLPIVVLAFQLWWMLSLRFCIPPSLSINLVADFFAAGRLLVDIGSVGGTDSATDPGKRVTALDGLVGMKNAAVALGADSKIANDPSFTGDLVKTADPRTAQLTPEPPVHLTTPPDPLCSQL